MDPNLRAALKRKQAVASSTNSLANRYRTAINSHNNFLLLSGHLDTNIKGTSFSVDVPKNFNQLELVVLTPASAVKKTFSLKTNEKRKFKDLRHAGISATEPGKEWTMSR